MGTKRMKPDSSNVSINSRLSEKYPKQNIKIATTQKIEGEDTQQVMKLPELKNKHLSQEIVTKEDQDGVLGDEPREQNLDNGRVCRVMFRSE